MSTILKALKKAEQESPEQQNKIRQSLNLNVRTVLNSRMQHQQGFFLSSKKWAFLMGAVFIIASVSYILFFWDKKNQPGLSPRIIQPQSTSMVSAKKEAQKTPDQAVIEDSQALFADAGQNDAAHKKDAPSPVTEKSLTTQKQDIKEKMTEKSIQPFSKNDSRKEEILPLKNEMLSIQAISWAKNPSDRIAVINSKIVGEGESVQGYDILEIGKDEVILRLSDQKFRLAFKYR
jgi:Type II secretion system protein B